MDNKSLLQIIDNLFSLETVFIFLYVLAFQICYYRFQKYTRKLGLPVWPTRFITVLTTIFLGVIVDTVIKYCTGIIYQLRYNPNEISSKFPHQNWKYWGSVLIATFIGSLLFLFYKYLSDLLTRKTKSFTKKSIIDGLIIFILISLCFLSLNTSRTGSVVVAFNLLGNDIVSVGICALTFVVYGYHHYLNTFKDHQKELEIVRLQRQVAQSQLDALSSKINPHFLYNALNAIAGLSLIDGSKTRDMAIALAKLFRYNINKEESNYASIDHEIEMVKIYLEIEKIRFEDQMQYSIIVPNELSGELIPRHLIQPLVENAVKHGAGTNGVSIRIEIKKEDKKVMISVGDNGEPFDTNFNPGYGIKSLYDKLDLLTSGDYEIVFLTEPKEVRITLGKNKLMQ